MRRIILLLGVILLVLAACTPRTKTVSEIMAEPGRYMDKEIYVRGVAVADNKIRCTLQICSEENPCCQSCSGDLLLSGQGTSITVLGGTCSGNNCGLECSPLTENKTYVVYGTLRERQEGYAIEVQNYEEAEDEI